MEFRILGPLEVWRDGRPVSISGARQRELLAILLLHAGEVVSTDRLMDALWGENQPAAGATALRVRISQLRKALGGGDQVLVTRAPGYALLVAPDGLDLKLFERRFERGERAMAAGDAPEALEHVEAALSLWRGPPLADCAYTSFAQTAIVRLEELRAAALELRIDAELALDRHARVVGELQALVQAHPLRERLWAQLMLALYRDGRQAEALAAYRAARTRLVVEIGIEPGPELQQLEARILAQDPGLAAGRPAARARRSVLAVPDPRTIAAGATMIAERLAVQAGDELLVFALVRAGDQLGDAHERLATLRQRDVGVRVAAFTTADAGADAVRLAAEQDAAVLVLDASGDALRSDALHTDLQTVLAGAVCDVVLVAGARHDELVNGPVLVPFGGHEHDWAAVEVGAWLAGDAPLRLLGVRGDARRDASRLLASASIALQRSIGIATEPILVDRGPDAVIAATAGAAAVVLGLSERWRRDGIGSTRLEIARRAACPVLLVRGGPRPGGLAPPHALTRFTWSGGA